MSVHLSAARCSQPERALRVSGSWCLRAPGYSVQQGLLMRGHIPGGSPHRAVFATYIAWTLRLRQAASRAVVKLQEDAGGFVSG